MLRLADIRKTYGAVVAVENANLEIEEGKVEALLGKNGAGKSTLVKILSGAISPDSGEIWLGGDRVTISSPVEAFKIGIATVHQEPHVVPDLSAADNIQLGRWGRYTVRAAAVRSEAQRVLERLGSNIDPDATAGRLSIAEWQIIEIARALTRDVRLLILDEPTSALGQEDADRLIGIVRKLAADGVSVIYVSHRLDEIPRVADHVTVLREGRVVKSEPIGKITSREIVQSMVGREWSATQILKEHPPEEEHAGDCRYALEVEDLRVPGRVNGVSFKVQPGEVVGLAGLVGAGKSEVLRGIYGTIPATGRVAVNGIELPERSPTKMKEVGLSMVSDDRKREGLFFDLSIADNIALGDLGSVSSRGIISAERRSKLAQRSIDSLGIKVDSMNQLVSGLSGGNQQKVVIARCLMAGSNVLLLDEPTRGVDVEAKFQIYEFLRQLAEQDLAVLVAPSEPEELEQVSDRLIVLRRGEIVHERSGTDFDLAEVMAYAMGDEPVPTA